MVEKIERLCPKFSCYALVDREFLNAGEVRIDESRRAKIPEHAGRVTVGKRRRLAKVAHVKVFVQPFGYLAAQRRVLPVPICSLRASIVEECIEAVKTSCGVPLISDVIPLSCHPQQINSPLYCC